MTTPKPPPAAKHPPAPDEEDLSIVYPSGDGEPMADNDWQWIAMADTALTLRNRYAGRTDVYVASDMLVYYRMNDVSARVAPDVYAVFGASGNHRRDSWIVWREGKAPDFVLEVASPRTWRRDAGDKRDTYAAMESPSTGASTPGANSSCRNWWASVWSKGNTGRCPFIRTKTAHCGATAPYWGWTSASVLGWSCVCTTRPPGSGSSRRRRATRPIRLRKRPGKLRRRPGSRPR